MADAKITALTELTVPSLDDLLAIVDDPGGTPVTKKITLTNLFANGQIPFPATQNPSAGANTLDDYEEGTWTPTIGGAGGTSGQTYATRIGHYVKCGQIVVLTFRAELSAEGTITGNAQIQGFPFTVSAARGAGIIKAQSLATSVVAIDLEVAESSTIGTIYMKTAAATSETIVTATDIGNTTDINGTIVYRASA